MRNRMTGAASLVATLVIAASGLSVQPGQAQLSALFPQLAPATPAAQAAPAAQAKSKADECLARPGTTAPKGSHWFYRLERPSQRRCWYLGPASQKVRAERAARTERTARTERAVPTPAPAPAELRADEPTRAGPPPAAAAETSATGTAPAYSVAATQFSAAWPAAPNAAATSAHDVPTVGSHDNTEAAAAAAQTPAEDTAVVQPVMTAADRTASQPSEPAPGVAHLLIFLSATAAFVAIAFRTVLKLAASRRGQGDRRPAPRAAGPVIRPRAPELRVSEPSIEAMSEPAIARLREIAKRWDTPARVPHQPRLPTTFEAEPDHAAEGPALRRRRVA